MKYPSPGESGWNARLRAELLQLWHFGPRLYVLATVDDLHRRWRRRNWT